jgi:hypothetical protein
MPQHATRLADLIEHGRQAVRTKWEPQRPVAPRPEAVGLPLGLTLGAPMTVALDLALLGEELLCLSRTRTATPEALVQDALRSIEHCLVAIRHQA